ncbi:DUF2913 family protein [Shewanella ulleungensis]|jgi:hypothetical protein|uniref:DUF2913 domain-containing protein n=1 Tax=Shewanella ulleungensis TaxID=2282699 RepID=A0ABQ2QHN8_9GAMM|nr:DUF2913 family protein [Shewanella ulleungensis]MCL1149589.1 DUF2913 family protein [Shewanella ulleungensis]GGP80071.1 DUF2913 domain-containing protein [Shewanella ulleungensis]
MTTETYNQALLTLALAGIDAINTSASQHKAPRTPAQESHFLCNWMVESLKTKRFSKLVADDLTSWIRQARSQGAGAQLKRLLTCIADQYQQANDSAIATGAGLKNLLAELTEQNWVIITDTDIDAKLKLDSVGQSSLIISAKEFNQHIIDDNIVKPISMYIRGDENQVARLALAQGILLSQGNKKTTLIKHHKTYTLRPKNLHPSLCLLCINQY